MKRTQIIILAVIFASFVISIYLYPKMPDKMASHWNTQGEVDGYLPKSWGLFLLPVISLVTFLLFLLIPKIDPLKENIEKFRKYLDWFLLLIILFLFYIYLLTVFWSLGFDFKMNNCIIPAMGFLFFYIGILLERAKRNWFVGIRTPWTISSEEVWNNTHKVGAKLFKVAGIIAFFGFFFGNNALLFVIFPILLISVYLVFYSYFDYQREKNKTC